MPRKGEHTKQRILSAANLLFMEKGYTAVSMQDICNESKLSKGGLYRHYENKTQIFTELLQQAQGGEIDTLAQQIEQGIPAIQILRAFIEHTYADMNRTPNLNIALYEFCIEHKQDIGNAVITAQYERGRKSLIELIRYGISRGEFQVSSPEEAADSILFLIEGIKMINEIMHLSQVVADGVFHQVECLLRKM